MAKFNTTGARTSGTSPIRAEASPSTTTFEGGAGYARDWRSELFLLAVTNLVGEASFYESARQRDSRYSTLIRHGAVTDPEWTTALLSWLRREANLRTGALVGAAEFAAARRAAGLEGFSRQAVTAVVQRADEPGELLAYWTTTHGKTPPMPVKKGLNDAINRLWTERALLKWDSPGRAWRFGDVAEITHPRPAGPQQAALVRYALDRRRPWGEVPAELDVLRAHAELMAVPVAERRAVLEAPGAAERLRAAGITWESLAGWLQGPMDKLAWETMIPSMGIMARIRNLRNFDQAGVSDAVARQVADQLADPDEIAASRQMPMRFLSAYRQAPSLRWSYPLEQALQHSLGNVPWLRGSTLVLVDTSGSMRDAFSKDGSLKRWDAAALFGLALATRCEKPEVVSFSSARRYWGDVPGANTKTFPLQGGESVLAAVRRWDADGFFLGGGTDTALALRQHYTGHDRVVILTDEQASDDDGEVTDAVPATIPVHTFNLAGYAAGHSPSGTAHRYTYGGLTDACFRLIPLVEAGARADWPWANG